MDLYEQPTLPNGQATVQEVGKPQAKGISRRKALGLGAAGLLGAGALGAGGFALTRWWQEQQGQGAMGQQTRIGHLDRKSVV